VRRALPVLYPLVKGVKHPERHLTSVPLVCLERAVCRLSRCSGLANPLQQIGHAAPAADSPVPTERGALAPVLHSPKGLKKHTGIL